MNEHIWVVNNNRQSTEEYTAIFSSFQVEVVDAQSLRQRIEQGPVPELIVVSARQSAGESSGFFITKQIKKVFNLHSVPVVVISADTDAGEEAESLSRGADEYFYEPLSRSLVEAKVKRLLADFEELRRSVAKGMTSWSFLNKHAEDQVSGCSVIVVDDEIKHREILDAALRDKYNVTLVASGVEAIELCQQNEFDLMMLDIKMPELDGYQVIQTMFEKNLIRTTPVVFGTGKSRVKHIVKGLEVGAVDYLQKPYVPAVVAARIDVQMRRSLKLRWVRGLGKKVVEVV